MEADRLAAAAAAAAAAVCDGPLCTRAAARADADGGGLLENTFVVLHHTLTYAEVRWNQAAFMLNQV